MKTFNTTRRLTNTLVLLAVIAAGQVQANETLQVAENGSERTLQQSRKQLQNRATELAENGSERTLQRTRRV